MLILFVIISLLFVIISSIFWILGDYSYEKREKNKLIHWCYHYIHQEFLGYFLLTASIILLSIFAIVTTCVGAEYSNNLVIQEKIEMYQEENEQIEQEITDIIYNYQQYEKETFANAKIENINVALNLYPELKSDELVKQQMTIYAENNKEIKSLRAKQLDYKVLKWWLIF